MLASGSLVFESVSEHGQEYGACILKYALDTGQPINGALWTASTQAGDSSSMSIDFTGDDKGFSLLQDFRWLCHRLSANGDPENSFLYPSTAHPEFWPHTTTHAVLQLDLTPSTWTVSPGTSGRAHHCTQWEMRAMAKAWYLWKELVDDECRIVRVDRQMTDTIHSIVSSAAAQWRTWSQFLLSFVENIGRIRSVDMLQEVVANHIPALFTAECAHLLLVDHSEGTLYVSAKKSKAMQRVVVGRVGVGVCGQLAQEEAATPEVVVINNTLTSGRWAVEHDELSAKVIDRGHCLGQGAAHKGIIREDNELLVERMRKDRANRTELTRQLPIFRIMMI